MEITMKRKKKVIHSGLKIFKYTSVLSKAKQRNEDASINYYLKPARHGKGKAATKTTNNPYRT